jgi:hypothetical protein
LKTIERLRIDDFGVGSAGAPLRRVLQKPQPRPAIPDIPRLKEHYSRLFERPLKRLERTSGAITRHASLSELVRYTKAADQRRLAEVAMTKTRTSGGKPAPRVAKKAEKSLQLNLKKQMS